MENEKKFEKVIVIGAGPCGIAAAAELKRRNIDALIIEKGAVTESIRRYPKRMKFFSTAENIEIAGIPFPTGNVKPARDEALQYYRKVAQYYELRFNLNTEVTKVARTAEGFEISTVDGKTLYCENAILATGYFDKPRLLGLEGEDLPRVSHYYDEPYLHSFTKVAIIGGGNSAIEAALELYRHNVEVTMIVRGPDFKPTAKYWLVPDIKNRIKEGKIKVVFEANAEKITKEGVHYSTKANDHFIESSFVYVLTGYVPDDKLLKACGLNPDPDHLFVNFNEDTMETEIEDLYLCGTVTAGIRTEKVFIENGREHAKIIAGKIAEKVGQVPSGL